jgi:hypothetical protein
LPPFNPSGRFAIALTLLCLVALVQSAKVICADKKGSTGGFTCETTTLGNCPGSSSFNTCCPGGCTGKSSAFSTCAGTVGYCESLQTPKVNPQNSNEYCCIEHMDTSCTDYSSVCVSAGMMSSGLPLPLWMAIAVAALASWSANW